MKERIFPGVHKIGAPISGPRIADTNFTDTRIFLNDTTAASILDDPGLVKTLWLSLGDLRKAHAETLPPSFQKLPFRMQTMSVQAVCPDASRMELGGSYLRGFSCLGERLTTPHLLEGSTLSVLGRAQA